MNGHKRLRTVAGTIQKRRAEARRRGLAVRGAATEGRPPTRLPMRVAREGVNRGDADGEQEENDDEN